MFRGPIIYFCNFPLLIYILLPSLLLCVKKQFLFLMDLFRFFLGWGGNSFQFSFDRFVPTHRERVPFPRHVVCH